jgi:hypothetical protein
MKLGDLRYSRLRVFVFSFFGQSNVLVQAEKNQLLGADFSERGNYFGTVKM